MFTKIRTNAVIFAFMASFIVAILIFGVISGPAGRMAFGEEAAAAAAIASALLIVGVAVGGLITAMVELSKDGPPPSVPAQIVSEILQAKCGCDDKDEG